MSATQPKNLDLACAETGRALAAVGEDPKQIENTLTKTLGVLQEQGVYALFLFLFSRKERLGVAELATLLDEHCKTSGLSEKNGEIDRLSQRLKTVKDELAEIKRQAKMERRSRGSKQTNKSERQETLENKEEEIGKQLSTARDGFFKALGTLADDLEGLLFARELLERALVYGRYHAKARGGSEGGE